jgi:hypothetical protein
MIRRVVVLPQPEGPRREKNSPSAMPRDTESTARVPPGKIFVTASSATAAWPLIGRVLHGIAGVTPGLAARLV